MAVITPLLVVSLDVIACQPSVEAVSYKPLVVIYTCFDGLKSRCSNTWRWLSVWEWVLSSADAKDLLFYALFLPLGWKLLLLRLDAVILVCSVTYLLMDLLEFLSQSFGLTSLIKHFDACLVITLACPCHWVTDWWFGLWLSQDGLSWLRHCCLRCGDYTWLTVSASCLVLCISWYRAQYSITARCFWAAVCVFLHGLIVWLDQTVLHFHWSFVASGFMPLVCCLD